MSSLSNGSAATSSAAAGSNSSGSSGSNSSSGSNPSSGSIALTNANPSGYVSPAKPLAYLNTNKVDYTQCDICQDGTPAVYCEQCGFVFCHQNSCDRNFHLFPEYMTSHIRRPIKQVLANQFIKGAPASAAAGNTKPNLTDLMNSLAALQTSGGFSPADLQRITALAGSIGETKSDLNGENKT